MELSPTNLKAVGVLGNGKGTVFPKYEMDSVYNFIIEDANSKNPEPWLQIPILPPPGIKPTILAVVASASLDEELDLKKIANIATNLSYDESSYTQLVMRIYDPIATAMYWKPGNMVVTGTESVENAGPLLSSLQQPSLHVVTKEPDHWICGFKTLRLNVMLASRFESPVWVRTSRTPFSTTQIFLLESWIQLTIPKAKIIVFRTGSILIIGVKSEEELDEVFHIVYPYLKLFAV